MGGTKLLGIAPSSRRYSLSRKGLGKKGGRQVATRWALFGLMSAGLLIGCGSPQERSARHMEQAEHWAAEGKINEAIVEYRRAIQLNPKDPKAHLALAKIFIDRQEYQSGAQQIGVVRKGAPDNREAQVMMADLELKTRNPDKAREQAQALVSKYPDDTESLMILAESSFAMKDIREWTPVELPVSARLE